jgi:hypothetical protein
MQSILTDASLQKDLVQKGKERLALFSWTKAAKEIETALSKL